MFAVNLIEEEVLAFTLEWVIMAVDEFLEESFNLLNLELECSITVGWWSCLLQEFQCSLG